MCAKHDEGIAPAPARRYLDKQRLYASVPSHMPRIVMAAGSPESALDRQVITPVLKGSTTAETAATFTGAETTGLQCASTPASHDCRYTAHSPGCAVQCCLALPERPDVHLAVRHTQAFSRPAAWQSQKAATQLGGSAGPRFSEPRVPLPPGGAASRSACSSPPPRGHDGPAQHDGWRVRQTPGGV